MMKTTTFLFFLLTVAVQSCQSPDDITTFWVSGIQTECDAGAGETTCIQISKTNDLDSANWETFYAPINGFEFEDGTLQQIEVKKEAIENPPADGSSISYSLIKVLNKQPDTRMGLHDIWACKMIAGIPIDTVSEQPSIEINLRKMMVMGTNGCNRFNGGIENITSTNIKFGPMAETRMMCADMQVPDAFNVAMNNVATYQREDLVLRFYDEQGSELLSFLKVD